MDKASTDTHPSRISSQNNEKLQSAANELQSLKEENRQLLHQFEEIATRANMLTVEAEIARLEFDQVFDAVGDPLWVVDNEKTVLKVNKAFLDLLNLGRKRDAIGRKCYELFSAEICLSKDCPLEGIKNGSQRIERDVEIKNEKGIRVPLWLSATPLFGVAHEIIGIVEQCKDITERKNHEKALKKVNSKLEKLASVDGLTQLANRRAFDEALAREWRRMYRERQPLSIILSDIDFFKRFNDRYGHQAGDQCLKLVADTIKKCIKRPADLAARYGGEEFVVVLPNTPSEGAMHIAEKMRSAVADLHCEHEQSDVSPYVTLSLGVAAARPSQDNESAESLIKAADDALYTSKKSGRNQVTVHSIT